MAADVTGRPTERQGDYYVGVDAGLRSSSLCVIDEQGKMCLEREVASEIEEIAAAIGGFAEHVDRVALETGNLTPWLTAGLRAEGFRVVVMEARQVKTTLPSLPEKPLLLSSSSGADEGAGAKPQMSAAHLSASESKASRPDPTNACGSSGSRRYADHEKNRDPPRTKRSGREVGA